MTTNLYIDIRGLNCNTEKSIRDVTKKIYANPNENVKGRGYIPYKKMAETKNINEYVKSKFEYVDTIQQTFYGNPAPGRKCGFTIPPYNFRTKYNAIKNIRIRGVNYSDIEKIELEVGGCLVEKIYNLHNNIFPVLQNLYCIDDESVLPLYCTSKIHMMLVAYHEIIILVLFKDNVTTSVKAFDNIYAEYDCYKHDEKYECVNKPTPLHNTQLNFNKQNQINSLFYAVKCMDNLNIVLDLCNININVWLHCVAYIVLDFKDITICSENKLKCVTFNIYGNKINNVLPYKINNSYIVPLTDTLTIESIRKYYIYSMYNDTPVMTLNFEPNSIKIGDATELLIQYVNYEASSYNWGMNQIWFSN